MRKFRVIQGGKQSQEELAGSSLRLFRAYSLGNLTRGGKVYYDVRFNWYCLERPAPVAPYETLIADYERLDEQHLSALKKEVDRYFTEEEVVQLKDYLEERYGLALSTEEVPFPIKQKGIFFEEGSQVIYDFLELSGKEHYSLPFDVWGYYTILGCLSTPELENAVLFLRKSFELLGIQMDLPGKDLESIVKSVYEKEGLVVNRQKEKT
jgi:hypothetical protein